MKRTLSFLITLFALSLSIMAMEESNDSIQTQEKEGFDAAELIIHHISDAHVWEIVSWGEGENKTNIEIPLPIILINKGAIHCFLYSRFDPHTNIAQSNGSYFLYHHGEIYNTDAEGNMTNTKPWDLSLTRNVLSMWISVLFLIWLFLSIAKKYKGEVSSPSGMQSLLEPIILFVKEDIVEEQIGAKKGEKYVPYLLTVFFFIWINNLIGLVPFFPGGSNLTGNISVTLVLSALTLLITSFSGSKSYWKHTFTAPGVPVLVKFILVPVEIISLFTKPFALMIRLLANITAGHIIILSLISIIFILNTVYVSPVSVLLSLVMFILELLVAVLQAYIFTLLSALFIGMAVADDEH